MRTIIDEVYYTYNEDLGDEWLVQFSSKIYEQNFGLFKMPKSQIKKENEILYFVGAAHYMFLFEENGTKGIFLTLLEDKLFQPGNDKLYEDRINKARERVLTNNPPIPFNNNLNANSI